MGQDLEKLSGALASSVSAYQSHAPSAKENSNRAGKLRTALETINKDLDQQQELKNRLEHEINQMSETYSSNANNEEESSRIQQRINGLKSQLNVCMGKISALQQNKKNCEKQLEFTLNFLQSMLPILTSRIQALNALKGEYQNLSSGTQQAKDSFGILSKLHFSSQQASAGQFLTDQQIAECRTGEANANLMIQQYEALLAIVQVALAMEGGSSGDIALKHSTVKQTSHSPYITSYKEQVSAVQEDVKRGSGRIISKDEAKKMLYGIQSYSGAASARIRKAYNNPAANPKDAEMMRSVDDYIHASPKWEGTIYRGINVTNEEANQILSGQPIDMLGPSSWSSDLSVAEKFSNGYKDVRIVFVLNNNKSGASITHIGSYNGNESEVTAPSGIKYQFDGAKKIRKMGSDIVYIDVHE